MKPDKIMEYRLSRRSVLAMGGCAVLMAIFGSFPASASPKEAKARLAELTAGAKLQKGRIHINLPKLTQDGKRTRINVSVDSPDAESDYVKAVHILAERNTVPDIASYRFSPLSGICDFTTRIRVAKSQTIIVAAQMNDGSVYIAKARCKVARGAGGCG